jgi:hypothetical protein
MNLSANVKIRKVKAASTADTSAVNSDVVDMSGYSGVMFFTTIGTANAGNYIKAQQDTDAAMGTAADLTGTKVVAAADTQVTWLDIFRPLERYVRVVVTRGASTTVGDIYAILYDAANKPCDNLVDDVIIGELYASPVEGTA